MSKSLESQWRRQSYTTRVWEGLSSSTDVSRYVIETKYNNILFFCHRNISLGHSAYSHRLPKDARCSRSESIIYYYDLYTSTVTE